MKLFSIGKVAAKALKLCRRSCERAQINHSKDWGVFCNEDSYYIAFVIGRQDDAFDAKAPLTSAV